MKVTDVDLYLSISLTEEGRVRLSRYDEEVLMEFDPTEAAVLRDYPSEWLNRHSVSQPLPLNKG